MMKHEKRYINTDFEIRELGNSGTFSGTITTFGGKGYPIGRNINETFKRGSLAKTLSESNGNLPIFYEHRGEQIGWGINGVEGSKGVDVEAWLNIDNSALAMSQWAIMQKAQELKRARVGLSVGFNVITQTIRKGGKGEPDLRVVTEARLLEYSVTPFPANPKAGVTSVRSIQDLMDSVDELSIEERSLLMSRLNEMLIADPPAEPKHSLHSIIESLDTIIQKSR